jgi:hypothetical protein
MSGGESLKRQIEGAKVVLEEPLPRHYEYSWTAFRQPTCHVFVRQIGRVLAFVTPQSQNVAES